MKLVKFFLRIIALAVILFLATGLLIKEVDYQVSIAIEKPLDTIFTEFKDPLNSSNWIPSIKKITPIDLRDGVVGSIYSSVFKTQENRTLVVRQEILAYIPNKKITFFYEAGDRLETSDFVFSQEDNITIIIQHTSLRSRSYLQQCLFPFLKNSMIEKDQQYLNNFKSYIEKSK